MIYTLLGGFLVSCAVLVYLAIQGFPDLFCNRMRRFRERLRPKFKVEEMVRERMHTRERYASRLRWKLKVVSWPIGIRGLAVLSLGCAIGSVFVMGTATQNWWAGLILSLLGFLAPIFLLDHLYQKKKSKQDEALEGIIDQISNLYRVHGSFYRALFEATQKMDGVLREHFQQVLADFNVGRSMSDALEELAFRLNNPDLHLFTLAVGLHERYGGPTDEIVAQISETIRERRTMRAERKAETAGQNVMISILLLAPPLLFLMIWFWLPGFRDVLQNTLWGHIGVAFMTFNEVLVILLLRWLTANPDI